MLTSESVDSPEDASPVLAERLDLPSFLREGVRLLDDAVEQEINLEGDLEQVESSRQAIQSHASEIVEPLLTSTSLSFLWMSLTIQFYRPLELLLLQ